MDKARAVSFCRSFHQSLVSSRAHTTVAVGTMVGNTSARSGNARSEILFSGPSKIAARDIYDGEQLSLLRSREQSFYDYSSTDLIGVYSCWSSKITEKATLMIVERCRIIY